MIIDVHQHFIPPEYIKALETRGILPKGGIPMPKWNVGTTLEIMNKCGIEKSIMFLSDPGVFFGDKEWAKYLARMVNEFAARQVGDYSRRFGAFATLPLPDINDALREMEYALNTLKLAGVAMTTNVDGRYLGDPEFDDLFAELNRRKALVFLHPTAPPPEQLPKIQLPPSCLEFVFDTTRAVQNLMISGTFERYRDIRFIVAHAGGTIPYLSQRLEGMRSFIPAIQEATPRGINAYLQDLYYDTALSYSDTTLGLLQQFVGPSHILFGSDYPFANTQLLEASVDAVANFFGVNDKIRTGVERGNALALLGCPPR